MSTKKLKQEAKLIEPLARIGKSGLTQNSISEINKLLEKKHLIKIKMLKSALKDKDKKRLAKELAEKTNSKLIDRVGFTATLYKE